MSDRVAWQPVLPADQRDALVPGLLEAAREITDPARLDRLLVAHRTSWRSESVAEGDAGLALLCGQLDRCFPGQGWDLTARHFLSVALRAAESRPSPALGLLTGVSGLVFVAGELSRGRAAGLDVVAARAAESTAAVDLASGTSGIGAALLALPATAVTRTALEPILRRLLDGMEFPSGTDLGLEHGVPGPLALLALALRAGVEVQGQREALRHGCAWLLDQQAPDRTWPPFSGDPSTGPTGSCCGTPGIARVLWLSGVELDDPSLRARAVEAMEAVYARAPTAGGAPSPAFCHGVAGLLQITLRFAHDTGAAGFVRAAEELVAQIGSDIGDHPGLLEGSAGVILGLLAAATDVEPTWDRLFMLS